MIKRLTINHYRSIANLDLQLTAVNVFAGPNGVGKSNILDAICFVRDATANGLDQAITDRHGIQTIRQWSPTRPYDISIEIEISEAEGNGTFALSLASRGDKFQIKREEGYWRYEFSRRIRDKRKKEGYRLEKEVHDYHYLRHENGRVEIKDLREDEQTNIQVEDQDDLFLNSRYAYRFSGLRYSLWEFEKYSIFPNTLRQPEKQSTDVYLQSHGENLASVLRRMRRKKRSEAISEIIESLNRVLPNLRNITVQSVAGLLTPQFLMQDSENVKPHFFHVNQMSDGTLRILGLLVALYQDPRPDVIALEEPELTVHPGVLQILAESIREICETNQILVTTHSPSLIDRFDPSEVIAVEWIDGATVARPLNKSQINAVKEKLLGLGELMTVEGLHG